MNDTSSQPNIVQSARWSIRLFGALEIGTPEKQTLFLNGKKAGELLACLALQPGIKIRREDLAERCWPENESQRQRTRLRQEISALRTIFGDNVDSPLVVTHDHVQLRLDLLEIDTQQFDNHMAAGTKSDLPLIQAEHLSEAIAFYREDLLMEYPDSFLDRRSEYTRRYESGLHHLANLRRTMGDSSGAKEYLQRLITRNPLLEEAHADLMRVFAECRQPSEVRRQYNELESILRAEIASEPTESTRRLRTTLLENMTHVDTTHAVVGASSSPSVKSALPAIVETEHTYPSSSVSKKQIQFRNVSHINILALAAVILIVGFWFSKHHRDRTTHSASVPRLIVERGKATWTYIDKSEPGEKPNSEATASLLMDNGNLFVTGIVQTEHDDDDFLTVAFDSSGKRVFREKFSSIGHECDTATSIAVGRDHTFFVAGETYYPPHYEVKEGWHTTVVYYNLKNGDRWHSYSPMTILRSLKTQVISDQNGGAIVAATVENKNSQHIIFLHYDAAGKLIKQWTYPASGNDNASFVRMCSQTNGTFYVCASIIHNNISTPGADTDYALLCFQNNSILKWERFSDIPIRMNNVPASIVGDRNGDVFVAGVFSTGNPNDGTAAMCPYIVKYNSFGHSEWSRTYIPFKGDVKIYGITLSDDGSAVTIAGTMLNATLDIDGVALSYSGDGTLLRAHKGNLPSAYRSAQAINAYLLEDSRLLTIESISRRPFGHILESSEMAVALSDPKEHEQSIYSAVIQPQEKGWAIPRFAIRAPNSILIGGHTPQGGDKAAFTVMKFPLSPK